MEAITVRKVDIEIKAEHTEGITMMSCDHCNNDITVKPEKIALLKVCPFCLTEGALYPTYDYIAVPTMQEIDEVDVTVTINGQVVIRKEAENQ